MGNAAFPSQGLELGNFNITTVIFLGGGKMIQLNILTTV